MKEFVIQVGDADLRIVYEGEIHKIDVLKTQRPVDVEVVTYDREVPVEEMSL